MLLKVLSFLLGLAVTVDASASGCAKIRCKDGSNDCFSDSCARNYLQSQGISIHSSGGCSDPNNSHCTSLNQIHSAAIDGSSSIVGFKAVSGCPVKITGGTEIGHASGTYSHGNGWKLDIGGSGLSCYDRYVKGHLRKISTNVYCASSGNKYFYEGNHYDINYGHTWQCN